MRHKIVIVGDYPDPGLLARYGGSSQIFQDSLRSAGLSLRDVFFTTLLKSRPPGGDIKALYKGGEPNITWRICQEELIAELSNIRPNVILAMGEEALRALTGRQGMGV